MKNTLTEIFRRKFSQWNRDNFLIHTGVLVLGTKLGDLFNFIYRIALVRLLTVDEYGILNSLISFTLIFNPFIAPFQPALTKSLAEYLGNEEFGKARYVIRKAGAILGLFSTFIIAVFIFDAFFTGYLSGYLNINSKSFIVLVGLLVAGAIIAAVPRAFLQGAQLFYSMAWISAASALIKLALGLGLVYLGFKVSGGLWGFIICLLFVSLVGTIFIKRYFNRRGIEKIRPAVVSMAPIYRYFIPTGLLLGSFLALTNMDVVLVRHFYPGKSGIYSVAQMAGLIIFFLPGAITMVIFPKVAAARARQADSLSLLKKSLVLVAVFCLLGVLAFAMFPGELLGIITGKTAPQSVELVPWFALVMSFHALTMLVLFYHLASHNTRIVSPMVLLAAAEAVTIYLYHPTLKSILFILLFYSATAFALSIFMIKFISTPIGRSHE